MTAAGAAMSLVIASGCEDKPAAAPVATTKAPAPHAAGPAKQPEAKQPDAKPVETKQPEAKPVDGKGGADGAAKPPLVLSGVVAQSTEKVINKTTLPSGLVIEDLKMGEGAVCLPMANVVVHVRGWVVGNDKPFDDTRSVREKTGDDPGSTGEPVSGNVRDMLKGMKEGMVGMKVGGKRRLHIPSDLGYAHMGRFGPEGPGGEYVVPPGADLVYEVDLIDIQQKLVLPGEKKEEAKKDEPKPAPNN